MNTLRPRTLLAAALTIALQLSTSTGRCDDTYFAFARLEVRPATTNDLRTLRALLPKDDASVTLKEPVRNAALFDLGVTSADPQLAAKRANELAISLQAALKNAGDKQKIIIWERAEVPKAPSIPKQE